MYFLFDDDVFGLLQFYSAADLVTDEVDLAFVEDNWGTHGTASSGMKWLLLLDHTLNRTCIRPLAEWILDNVWRQAF